MRSIVSSPSTRLITLPLLVLFLTGLAILGFYVINQQTLLELGDQSKNRLTLFVSNLSGSLAKYEHLPRLISTNPKLLNTLQHDSADFVDLANRFLQAATVASGATHAYLMDHSGLTIATSNWGQERSFMGKNFSFRPYFKSAIGGQAGRYFALGTTSQQRGYYFSHPVYYDDAIAGVVVIKINLADIETAWSDRGNQFLVTDADGIVFLSTHPQWTYRTIRDIDTTRLEEIMLSRRYAGEDILPLKIETLSRLDKNLNLVRISEPGFVNYLHLSQNMPNAGWTVHLLTDIQSIRDTLILRATAGASGVLIIVLLVSLYLVNRQRRLALQGSTVLLEKRVQKRTRELQNQVDERKKAEQTLRDTQAELIQAAKLAGLGQMSAGISHELNQPLTAIRNYAENARRLLEREQLESASNNLHEIAELTERMANIIAQLRGFSRKSSGERSRVSVKEAIEQALAMFQREIANDHVKVLQSIDPELTINTDPLLLNQVLVNLMSNAIQAMSEVEKRQLEVNASMIDSALLLSICDTGPGIPDQVIDNIFDPFFTTKEVGLGLGLGLSISYRIMESLGGRIEVSNNATGGARFELYLPYD